MSDRLIDALEREFPRVLVEQVDNVEAACIPLPHTVALLLVDFAVMAEVEAAAEVLREIHPYALTAVIQPEDKRLPLSLADIAESPIIRSVLPMDIKLDVWLAIIRLMLCGGAYLPPELTWQAISERKSIHGSAKEHHEVDAKSLERRLASLTARETQILASAARGMQNKRIASEFNLSENTVKAHLRSVIRKLGVRNRMEAAARFKLSEGG